MNCPYCGSANADQNKFCLKCGKPMAIQNPAQQPLAGGGRMRNLTQPNANPQTAPRQPAAPNFPPPQQPQPVYQQLPQQQVPQQPAYQQLPQQQVPQQPIYQNYQPPMQQQGEYISPPSGEAGLSALNIWGPFAGYGTRRHHVGWLMDGKATHLNNLIQRIRQRLEERQVTGMQISWQTLTAKGLLVETRPYFLVRKGLATLGLNISAFGKDLFISIATYIKSPISNFRVSLLIISVLLVVLGFPIMFSMLNAASSRISIYGGAEDAVGQMLGIICLLGPLLSLTSWALQIALVYSVYKWLTERDFLALLRVPPNEFNEDDLMAMEKAVEQTVRVSLDDIGLNPADLKPAAVQGQETRLI